MRRTPACESRYYKELDTYYQMSYRLGKILDEAWVARERAKTEDRIMHYLLKEKAVYIKRCRYCGRMLPVDSPFGYCEKCWRSGVVYVDNRSGARRQM